jgi:hypothetical protein
VDFIEKPLSLLRLNQAIDQYFITCGTPVRLDMQGTL